MAEKQPMQVKREGASPGEVMVGPFHSLRSEIDRVFDDFMAWSPLRGTLFDRPFSRFAMRMQMPAADVIEKGDSYEIDVDVPGMKQDNIEVVLSDGQVTVRGQIDEETEQKGKEYYSCERRHESFSRAFALPEGVDTEKVAADLENGVLKITLPKTAAAQKSQRKIDIKPH